MHHLSSLGVALTASDAQALIGAGMWHKIVLPHLLLVQLDRSQPPAMHVDSSIMGAKEYGSFCQSPLLELSSPE
jgi:hypothetical protein